MAQDPPIRSAISAASAQQVDSLVLGMTTMIMKILISRGGTRCTYPHLCRRKAEHLPCRALNRNEDEPDKMFPLINDLHNWVRWAPRDREDPKMKRTGTIQVTTPTAHCRAAGRSSPCKRLPGETIINGGNMALRPFPFIADLASDFGPAVPDHDIAGIPSCDPNHNSR